MSQNLPAYIRKQRRIKRNGIFYAILSSVSFGFSPLFSIGLMAVMSNMSILSYRWALAAIVLVIYSLAKGKTLRFNSASEFWKIVLLSILRSITSVTLLIGYANIASGIASIH